MFDIRIFIQLLDILYIPQRKISTLRTENLIKKIILQCLTPKFFFLPLRIDNLLHNFYNNIKKDYNKNTVTKLIE